jgi:hypothetical protein
MTHWPIATRAERNVSLEINNTRSNHRNRNHNHRTRNSRHTRSNRRLCLWLSLLRPRHPWQLLQQLKLPALMVECDSTLSVADMPFFDQADGILPGDTRALPAFGSLDALCHGETVCRNGENVRRYET